MTLQEKFKTSLTTKNKTMKTEQKTPEKPTRERLTFIEHEMSETGPFIEVMEGATKRIGLIFRSWDADNDKPVYRVENENGEPIIVSNIKLQDIKRSFIQRSKELFNSIIPEPPIISGQEELEDLKPAISRELNSRVKTIDSVRKKKNKNKSKGLNR